MDGWIGTARFSLTRFTSLSNQQLHAVDLFLIIAIAVTLSFLLIIAVYLLINFQHPDDKNDAYLPKLVVIFGIVLSGMTVLMLPLDVANNEGYAGT